MFITGKPVLPSLARGGSYDAMFAKFFNSTSMSSTYKPVFLKALLDVGDLEDESKAGRIVGRQWLRRSDGRPWLGKSDGRLFVDLNFIAVRFAKYYWDMEYSFKLRQSNSGNAAILGAIRRMHNPDEKPPTARTLAEDRMSEFRASVIRTSITKYVLDRLLTDMPRLYKKEGANEISLDPGITRYANQRKALLTHGLNYVMAQYLEKINRGTPNIAKKVGYNPGRIYRPPLCPRAVKEMRGWQRSLCFYCEREFEKPHVDHVIPFNFVFSTDLYNCVLACQRCNCKKSDTLLHRDRFDEVVDRNQRRSDYISGQKVVYNERSYRLLYDTCISEYNGDKAFFKPA